MFAMLWPSAALWITAVLLTGQAEAQYSSDQCSWRGRLIHLMTLQDLNSQKKSGLSHESHCRDVEQVYLRCSQGSLEWLYPTGAIIVNLRLNTELSSRHTAGVHLCIKAQPYSQGSHVYLEHGGDLQMLLAEEDQVLGTVRCFSLAGGALFVEAIPQTDISRRITAFQYELVPVQGPGAHMYPYLNPASVSCKPCADEEVLMAVCTSDFAGSGTFRGVASTNKHTLLVVTLSRLFHQKSGVFLWGGVRGRGWSGRVNIPRHCGRIPARDEYLLTGSIHFGEAWLSCAPLYRDFLRLYTKSLKMGTNPCQIDIN